ncbi:PAS-domain containing protein [Marinicella sp. S1101]|uniref:hybrid sensor histidine kinase/response regulator n=1 Tax=Marinicella marina TaxID=2996016 RepID=UPI002260CC5C|nr:PAS-domain containing protein [Marinicella marina]MCX7554921.1 PAS-domain containing protein [Marinicella marina]MDJ1141255.1 PAS-domain containing protein [Marinicella marina]
MFTEYAVYIILVLYMALMYGIARWGDGLNIQHKPRLRSWVYGLSLGVYCTSWTFFGAVGTAASKGWDFLPIYLGPLILFTVGWPLVVKIITLSKANNITSVADFIASLYGKSRRVAVLVTITAVVASIPYIALQLEAITASIDVISEQADHSGSNDFYSALLITVLLAFFSTIFGTRKLDVTEHHRGLMLSIAFESALKLLAFVAVGLFVVFVLFKEPQAVIAHGMADPKVAGGPVLSINFMAQSMLALMVFMCLPRQFHVTVIENESRTDLGKARLIFILYLLLFTLFVIPIALAGSEFLGQSSRADLYVLQLPMYYQQSGLTLLVFLGGLAAATGMVIIATIALSTMVSNDLILPLYLRFNHYHLKHKDGLQRVVLWSRRVSIFAISFAALVFYGLAHDNVPLAAMGNLSFLLMVQFAPAILLGIYWQRSNKQAAFMGMLAGVCAWFVMVFFPAPMVGVAQTEYGILTSMLQLTSDQPPIFKLFGVSVLSNIAMHVVYAFISGWLKQPRRVNRTVDAAAVRDDLIVADLKQLVARLVGEGFANISFNEFAQDLNHELSDEETASPQLIQFTETLLAGSIGSSSARAVMTAMLQSKGLAVNEILGLLDQTTQAIQFNRSLTEATLDNISQGVSVVDDNLRLIAWNKQYIELLEYPADFIKRGMPIEHVLRYNLKRGLMPAAESQQEIEKRLVLLRQRRSYQTERAFDNGRVLQIEGHPMPNGGYVTTYSDVTQYKAAQEKLIESQKQIQLYTDNSPAMLAYLSKQQRIMFVNKAYEQFMGRERTELVGSSLAELFDETELAKREPYLRAAFGGETMSFEMSLADYQGQEHFILGTYVPDWQQDQVNGVFVIMQDISTRRKAELELKQAKVNLEQRVEQRTEALSIATEQAQQANLSKTKFIADASHDLLQPFNAARLFTSILREQSDQLEPDVAETVYNLDHSLRAAENMLSALLDIAQFDAGGVQINQTDFSLNQLLQQLAAQYHPRAAKKGLDLRVHEVDFWLKTDEKLLYRVLQNLVSNAIRYTEKGGVLVTARRHQGQIQLWVIDTGVGLNDDEQIEIFNEFKRLNKVAQEQDKGLGLGLSIVDRIVKQLGLALTIRSVPGRGSSFVVTLEEAVAQQSGELEPTNVATSGPVVAAQKQVLCIDNEPQILKGMQQLLTGWGMGVQCVEGSVGAMALLEAGMRPDLLLVDYQLNDELGTDVASSLLQQLQLNCPVVLITANHSEALKTAAKQAGYHLLLKPIKPIKLRQMINQLLH